MPVQEKKALAWRTDLIHAYDYVLLQMEDGRTEAEIRKKLKLKPYSDEDIEYIFKSLPDYQNRGAGRKSNNTKVFTGLIVIILVIRVILFFIRMTAN